MHEHIQRRLTPELAEQPELLAKQVGDKLEISPARITRLRTTKKSIDARSFQPKVNLTVEVYWDEPASAPASHPRISSNRSLTCANASTACAAYSGIGLLFVVPVVE